MTKAEDEVASDYMTREDCDEYTATENQKHEEFLAQVTPLHKRMSLMNIKVHIQSDASYWAREDSTLRRRYVLNFLSSGTSRIATDTGASSDDEVRRGETARDDSLVFKRRRKGSTRCSSVQREGVGQVQHEAVIGYRDLGILRRENARLNRLSPQRVVS